MPTENKAAKAVADSDRTSFDLFNLPPDYFDNPYPWLKRLRDQEPIHRNADGSLLLTRYDDVRALWRDPSGVVDKSAIFRARFGEGPLLEHHTTSMLFRDPPDHDRLRALVNPFFSRTSLESLRPFIEDFVDNLLNEAAERRDLDFVGDFAFRLPIAVICRILGVPPEHGQRLHELGVRILFPLNPQVAPADVNAGHEAAARFKEFLADYLHTARARDVIDPGADVISALVSVERDGALITENEILHMCILILNGGHETTTNLIAVGLHSLLDQPDQLEILRRDPELAPIAVEELIRYVSPLQLQGRRTTREIAVPSGTLDAGTEIILCQASANRDERAFTDPERLDLERRPNKHVAFGVGIHLCVGQALARLEASIVFPRLLRRFRRIERNEVPLFNRNARFRGLAKLPLRLQ